MNVKIPQPPMSYSKAAQSTRQSALVANPNAPGQALNNSGRDRRDDRPWNKLDKKQEEALLTEADMILSDLVQSGTVGKVGTAGGDITQTVNRDLGRQREMCSSPRFHTAVQQRVSELDAEALRQTFLQKTLTIEPMDSLDPTPSSRWNTEPMTSSPGKGPSGSVPSGAKASEGRSPSGQQTKVTRPSSCFVSTSKRFVMVPSSVPPVGHYNVRYSVVDAEPRATQLALQQLDHLDGTLDSTRIQQAGLGLGSKPTQEVTGAPPAADTDSKKSDDEGNRSGRYKAESVRHEKPTSAFASRIPQLVSLTPRRSAYNDERPRETGNDEVLSGYHGPRGMVKMHLQSPRDREPSSARRMGSANRNPNEKVSGGFYDIDRGMAIAARPNTAGRLTIEKDSRSLIRFDKQISRADHITDGQKFSTFATSSPRGLNGEEPVAETGASHRRRVWSEDNGTSLDFVTVNESLTKPRVDVGYTAFHAKTSRKGLPFKVAATQSTTTEFEMTSGRHRHGKGVERKTGFPDESLQEQHPFYRHYRNIQFDKQVRPQPPTRPYPARTEVYDVQYDGVDPHVLNVAIDKTGSHTDHHSTFYHVAANPTQNSASAERELTGQPTVMEALSTHKKTVRRIDLSKLGNSNQGAASKANRMDATESPRSPMRSTSPRRSTRRSPLRPSPSRLSAGTIPGWGLHGLEPSLSQTEPLSHADAPVLNQRITGDPHIARHLSREDRARRLSPRPVATSDRDYRTDDRTLSREAQEKKSLSSALEISHQLSREKQPTTRFAAEMCPIGGHKDQEKQRNVGPGTYDCPNDRYGLPVGVQAK